MRGLIQLAAGAALAALAGGCVRVDNGSAAPVPLACPAARAFTAFVNAMPGPGAVPTLIVSGEIDVPPGATARLVPGPTDRMMPPGQRFSVELSRAAPGAATSGWQHVRSQISPALPAYREVIVGCQGKTLARIAPIERAY